MDHLTLERRGDELHLIGEAPQVVTIATEVLDAIDPRWMSVLDDDIVFSLNNGTWTYRVTSRNHLLQVVEAELVEVPPSEGGDHAT